MIEVYIEKLESTALRMTESVILDFSLWVKKGFLVHNLLSRSWLNSAMPKIRELVIKYYSISISAVTNYHKLGNFG